MAVSARTQLKLDKIKSEIEAEGVSCETVQFDFAKDTEYSKLTGKFSNLGILVNCVGNMKASRILD